MRLKATAIIVVIEWVTATNSSSHYNQANGRLASPRASSSAAAAAYEPATPAIPGKSSTGSTPSGQGLCYCGRASNHRSGTTSSRAGVPPAESVRQEFPSVDIASTQDVEPTERATSACPQPHPSENPVIHEPRISASGSPSITTGLSDTADASHHSFSAYNDPEYESVASTNRGSPVTASSAGISIAVVASAAVYGAAMVWLARRYRKRKRPGFGTISGPVTTTNSLGWTWT